MSMRNRYRRSVLPHADRHLPAPTAEQQHAAAAWAKLVDTVQRGATYRTGPRRGQAIAQARKPPFAVAT
jgi:hypothetical protein